MSEEFGLFRLDVCGLNGEMQRLLFQSFRELVYRDVYFLLNDHSLTEDAIQESFMKAIKAGPKTAEDSNMKAWIRRIARNTAYDILRKNKKYRHMLQMDYVSTNDELEFQTVFADTVDAMVEKTLRNETLRQALAELKPDYRIVLFLHYIMEMSYTEIGQELKLSEQVLTQRLARARKKLARQFMEKWGDQE